ncbi:MAG TPA: hypothetical protein VN843_07355, partial [Anaerolineales bacterium]|nr:hypothetical protein [Anaerolineales bacterium]
AMILIWSLSEPSPGRCQTSKHPPLLFAQVLNAFINLILLGGRIPAVRTMITAIGLKKPVPTRLRCLVPPDG